jgi:hypothetical protein
MIQNPMRSLKLPYTRQGDSWYVETFDSYALTIEEVELFLA